MSSEHVRAVVRSFDERAASYDESRMHRDLAHAVAEFALPDAPAPSGTVLDAATGTGLLLRALASRAPGAALVGVDLSEEMLAVARRHLPHARLFVADVASTGLESGSVDLVTCVTALHLFEHPDAAFAEWRRVLRAGGRVVTATFAEHGASPTARRPAYIRNHAPFATPERLASMARAHFRLARHGIWTDGSDRVLLAELIPR